ncbi:hypothetical protein BASA83_008241 [Batrachochytrium salamandrivorans]|nr:hypothetical protein BASA83_008241 [Batrachochytrium salamandrivorans]
MQFFYLLSFVVVASYAAALPQPAELPEQYSSNVDITLASILKARSYQPVSNSKRDSATLMSLERRDDSAGLLEGNFLFGIPPLSTLDYYEAKKLIYSLFKPGDFSFANISSTIKNVGDGFAKLSENGEKVGNKISGAAGGLLALGLNATISFIKSITPPAEFSKAVSAFISTFDESMSKADKKEAESNDFIVNILKDAGTVFQNVEAAIQSFVDALDILVKLFDVIKTLMSKSESGRIIYDDISNMMESLAKFTEEQQKLYEIIKTSSPPPSK